MEEERKIKTTRKHAATLAGQQIVIRFYIAIRELINRKVIRGIQTFTNLYNINRRAFLLIEKNPQKKMFDIGWLNYLVKDFNVNPEWLLLGVGPMFTKDPEPVKKEK